MNIFQAIFLGVIEGVTEFLPISSTFHLIWGAKLLGIGQTDFLKVFEVVIQSGAILAVVALYLRTVLKDVKLLQKVMVSFVPTALVGLVLYKIIKDVFFENLWLQISVFILVGIFFIIFEGRRRKKEYGHLRLVPLGPGAHSSKNIFFVVQLGHHKYKIFSR